jgi:hypothetical protein
VFGETAGRASACRPDLGDDPKSATLVKEAVSGVQREGG